MLIDCDRCAVQGLACGDCVVTVLLGAPPAGVELDPADRRALDALADGGLVPRLRLVPSHLHPANDTADPAVAVEPARAASAASAARANRQVG